MRDALLNSDTESLLKRIETLEREIVLLRAENERLKLELAAAKKDSRNSSKPPSSDIVKPPPSGGKRKRRIGGQPGHQPHFRTPFSPEQLDEVEIFEPPFLTCRCGGSLHPHPVSDSVRQQIDLRDNPVIRREFRAPAYYCSSCGAFYRGKLPRKVTREGFIGNRLAAALSFLNVKAHASYSALAAFMEEVCQAPVSRGEIAKTFQRVSGALETPYYEAVDNLRHEPVLNIDETGHREKGSRFWTWVFRAGKGAVFHIDRKRSSKVLAAMLGPKYAGIIGCDYYSAYHAYLSKSGGEAQFCQAHLIRELRFLRGHSDPETKSYAIRSLAAVRKLFRLYHHAQYHPEADRGELTKAGERVCRILGRAPSKTAAKNIAKRFQKHGDSYLRFLSHPLVEPTNNRAEQAIRQVVIDRAATQGTRSPKGRAYRERMWTVLSSCAKQHVSAFTFILNSLFAHSSNTAPPSLL